MSAMEVDRPVSVESCVRPRRHRAEPQRAFSGAIVNKKTLELDGIVNVLKEYQDYEGGINCSICGKLYKSKVCFTKHLWEHSVYWDLFDGEKNHDRVLSIQAALILYQHQSLQDYSYTDDGNLYSLLVTSPHQEKKKEKDINGNEIKSPTKTSTPEKKKSVSPSKRKSPAKARVSPTKKRCHSNSLSDSVCSSSGSDNETQKPESSV